MLEGIYTPIITPFKDSEEIDYDKLSHNLDRWIQTRLTGFVVLGSNGEFVFLSEHEKFELVQFVAQHLAKRKKMIMGTSCESTRETVHMNEHAAKLGADAVLILPPCYYKGGMKDEILYLHYIEVAEKSPVPVFIYNMPANTGISLSSSLIARLSQHPNIVGIKDTSGNIIHLTELVRDSHPDFAVFAGNAGYLLPALSVGAKGATLALANLLPEACCELVSLYQGGNLEAAKLLQIKLLEINQMVTAKYGIPALKAAMDLIGYQGGCLRRPLRPLSPQERKLLEEALVRYGALP
jgi:4-hydroxy-2-oxoglutarate aldolase